MGPNIRLVFTEEKTEEQMGLNDLPEVPLLGNGGARMTWSHQGGGGILGQASFFPRGKPFTEPGLLGRDWAVGQTLSLKERGQARPSALVREGVI